MRYEDAQAAPRLSTWSPDLVTVLHAGAETRSAKVLPDRWVVDYVRDFTPGLDDADRAELRVTLHECGEIRLLDRIQWHLVKLKPGAFIEIREVPRKGGALRLVLQVVVAVAAFALAGPLGAPLAALFAFGANLLLNALVPLKDGLKSNKQSPTYSLEGFKNVQDPDGPVPLVVGARHRFAPKYIVPPVPRIVNGKMFLSGAFVCGFSPMLRSKEKIGDRLIERFRKATFEYRGFVDEEGDVDTSPLTLVTETIIPQALDIEIRKREDGPKEGDELFEAEPTSLYTATNTLRWKAIVQLPEGLYRLKGKKRKLSSEGVKFKIEERLVTPNNDGVWTTLEEAWRIYAKKTRPFFREYERQTDLPVRGAYEVRWTRIDPDDDDDKKHSVVKMLSFQSILPEYPINQPADAPFALVGFDLMATNQLQGTLDEYNFEGAQLIDALNPESGEYEPNKETPWPADWYRWIQTMPIRVDPLEPEGLNDAEIRAWHAHNVLNGCRFRRVYDYEVDLEDVLDEVCQVGFAVKRLSDGLWGVSVDDRKDTLSAAPLTPHNTWGFELKRTYRKLGDAWRMKFKDELNDFRDAERLVLRPGFAGTEADAQNIEELVIPGITNPTQVYRYGYRRWLEIIHRPDMISDSQDWEAIELEHGHLAVVSHPMLDERTASGRVVSVKGNLVVTDEPVTMAEEGAFKVFFQRIVKEDGVGVRKLMIRDVEAAPGETRMLTLVGPGDAPERGDLFGFGPATALVEEAVVQSVEPDEKGDARVNLVNYAPQIFDEMDALVVPPYSSLVGSILPPDVAPPPVPTISGIYSSEEVYEDDETVTDNPRRIVVQVEAGDGLPAARTFEVQHRKLGEAMWRVPSIVVDAGAPSAVIETGYAKGENFEARPRALSRLGTPSGWGAVSSPHLVGQDDPVGPVALFPTATAGDDGLDRYGWTVAAADAGATAEVRIGPADSTDFDAMTPVHGGYLTASPFMVDNPTGPGSYTAGFRLTSPDGDVGAPVFIAYTVFPPPPFGFVLLVGADGAHLLGPDGEPLYGAA